MTEPTPEPLLVEVVCGRDEYGEPIHRLMPADTAGHWDDRVWRDQPI